MGFGAIFLMGMPLDQINFLPDLKQVNTNPLLLTFVLAFLQAVPAFGAAASALTVARSGKEIMKIARIALAVVSRPFIP